MANQPPINIEVVTAALFERVLPLIAAYQRFYETEPDEERNQRFFGQFVDDHRAGIQFIALDGSDAENTFALGFATLFFPYSSVSAGVTCLMNDLFVIPEARGRGVGRALIAHCEEYAGQHGFSRLHWLTFKSNATAQQLYNRMGAAQQEVYRYVLPVDET